jgi:hypothetical protein
MAAGRAAGWPTGAGADPWPWDPGGNPRRMGSHGVGMGLAWAGLAWGWHGVGMGLAWGWHGVSMGLAWGLPTDCLLQPIDLAHWQSIGSID